jgi:hypothetical protein
MSTSDTLSIEEIEQILSELEALARGASSSEIFYDQLLVRFRSLIQASQAAIVVALPQSKPFLKAYTGPVSDLALLDTAARLRSQEGETAFLVESFEDRSLIAVRRQNDPQPSEFLVASLDGRLDVASHPALRELGLAFCDVMHLRSMHRLERFLAEGWPLWCKFSESIANAESVSQAAQFAVEGFRAVLMADRVSIASDGQHISAIAWLPTAINPKQSRRHLLRRNQIQPQWIKEIPLDCFLIGSRSHCFRPTHRSPIAPFY